MKILFAGDLSVQDRATKELREKHSLTWKGISELTSKHDHSILNLESPITYSDKKIYKDGPYLKNDEEVLSIMKNYGFDIVTLANNHLKDYGNDGVRDTFKALEDNNVIYVGAGNNIEESRKPLLLEQAGERIGIVNVCESELAIATEDTPGAHPLDLIELFYDIPSLKKDVNKVIVIIHGGCEHYQLPTPAMKKRYHYIADLGADVIINHHQHCYSGYEIYNNVPIFYGLGNFFFDNPKKRNCIWNYGLLLSVDTTDVLHFKIIPFEQCNESPTINMVDVESELQKIERLNSIIKNDSLLAEEFKKELVKKKPLSPYLPYSNHYLRALYHRGLFPSMLSDMRIAEMLNKMRCETHFEVITKVLNEYLKNKTI